MLLLFRRKQQHENSMSSKLFPCIVCQVSFSNEQASICCDSCEKWTHFHCTKLTRIKFKYLSSSNSPYYCSYCHLQNSCPHCKKICKSNQNCIECSCCNSWLHLNCISLKTKVFNELSISNKDYNCEKCLESLLPFTNISNNNLISLFCSNNNSLNSSVSSPLITSSDSNYKYLSTSQVKQHIPNCGNFTFLNVNIRSLNTNFTKLDMLLQQLEFNPDVICVTETWLNDNKPLLYSLDNYNFLNEPYSGRAGGVGFFIKTGIQHNKIDLKLIHCDNTWSEINLSNLSIKNFKKNSESFENFIYIIYLL